MYLTHCKVVNMLIHLYAVHAWPEKTTKAVDPESVPQTPNGHIANGRLPIGRVRPERTVSDAEEFELHGLISDDDDDDDDHEVEPKRNPPSPNIHS